MPRLVQIENCFFWDNSLYIKFPFKTFNKVVEVCIKGKKRKSEREEKKK